MCDDTDGLYLFGPGHRALYSEIWVADYPELPVYHQPADQLTHAKVLHT